MDIPVPGDILNAIADAGTNGSEEFISISPRGRFSVDSVIGEAKKPA